MPDPELHDRAVELANENVELRAKLAEAKRERDREAKAGAAQYDRALAAEAALAAERVAHGRATQALHEENGALVVALERAREELRKLILWSECCAMRLPVEDRRELNWRDVKSARKVLAALALASAAEKPSAPAAEADRPHNTSDGLCDKDAKFIRPLKEALLQRGVPTGASNWPIRGAVLVAELSGYRDLVFSMLAKDVRRIAQSDLVEWFRQADFHRELSIKRRQALDVTGQPSAPASQPNNLVPRIYRDKNGREIHWGDTLYNPADRDMYHTVAADPSGNLYLDDFDSPLERYAPDKFWEVVERQPSAPAGEKGEGK